MPGVLHVSVRELGLERGDVVSTDALEDVRGDLAGGDVSLQVTGGAGPAGERVAVGLGESRAYDLLVEVLERRCVGDIYGPRRFGGVSFSCAHRRSMRFGAGGDGSEGDARNDGGDGQAGSRVRQKVHVETVATVSCAAQQDWLAGERWPSG